MKITSLMAFGLIGLSGLAGCAYETRVPMIPLSTPAPGKKAPEVATDPIPEDLPVTVGGEESGFTPPSSEGSDDTPVANGEPNSDLGIGVFPSPSPGGEPGPAEPPASPGKLENGTKTYVIVDRATAFAAELPPPELEMTPVPDIRQDWQPTEEETTYAIVDRRTELAASVHQE
jgi:hypothetical protein